MRWIPRVLGALVLLLLLTGLPVLADDISMVVESWKKILPMGIRRVHPAHGRDFPVEVMRKEIEQFQAV